MNLSKLRGFGSDGARPVMSGCRSGVAKRLTDRFPKLLSIHCVNHRLALAAAHAADDIPGSRQLYRFYSFSIRIVLYVRLVCMRSKRCLTIL